MKARTGQLISAMAPYFPQVAYLFPEYAYTSVNEIVVDAKPRVSVRFVGGGWTLDGAPADEAAVLARLDGAAGHLERVFHTSGPAWRKVVDAFKSGRQPMALLQLFRALDGDFTNAGHISASRSRTLTEETRQTVRFGEIVKASPVPLGRILSVFDDIALKARLYGFLNTPQRSKVIECAFPLADRAVWLPHPSAWPNTDIIALLRVMRSFEIDIGPYRFVGAVVDAATSETASKFTYMRKYMSTKGTMVTHLPIVVTGERLHQEIGDTMTDVARRGSDPPQRRYF